MPFAPALTIALLTLPVLAGLAGTVLPAFGLWPELPDAPSGFATLWQWPGFWAASRLSIVTGVAATLLSLGICILILAGWSGTRGFRWIERVLSPLLAVPHAAAAFGIAFLIAPSGWIMRVLSPWATGFDRPPDWLILNDPNGLALILGLVTKEVPFLLLISLAALPQCQPRRSMLVAQTLGYGRVSGWLKTVLPRLYPQIRLPIFAVLAFGMSVVDMAIILGPSTPPTLSVQVVEWSNDPALTGRYAGAAAALWQFFLVVMMLCLWLVGERLIARLGAPWIGNGGRGRATRPLKAAGAALAALGAAVLLVGIAGLGLWSVAKSWRFPEGLPSAFTMSHWMKNLPALSMPAFETMLIGVTTSLIALTIVLACLQWEARKDMQMASAGPALLYLPLIVPQVTFLPGLQALALWGGLDMGRTVVILAHLVFVLPYVYMSLSEPWRAWDTRQAVAGAMLGHSPRAVFWRIRLPMLLAPILTSFAVGLSVSIAQYLPTLMIGGGRVQTITTEAVALASGGNRRLIGVYALAQTSLVAIGFMLALALPRLVWANRRDMRITQ